MDSLVLLVLENFHTFKQGAVVMEVNAFLFSRRFNSKGNPPRGRLPLS